MVISLVTVLIYDTAKGVQMQSSDALYLFNEGRN